MDRLERFIRNRIVERHLLQPLTSHLSRRIERSKSSDMIMVDNVSH